jgi:hypothetical protein
MARTETNRLIQMISDGVVSSEQVVTMCMKYMSEDDVADMVDCNELSERFEEPDEFLESIGIKSKVTDFTKVFKKGGTK